VISVAAPHRRAAFEACDWLIKELKRTVPIWKKEFYANGSAWLEGENRSASL
jgi:molybdopterin synthase catalytic subunit